MSSTPNSNAPLSFEQEWLWLLDNAMPGLTAYNVPRALRLKGPLDVPSLERALGFVLERQPALRTTFQVGPAGDPRQVVAATFEVRLPVEDLSHLEPSTKEASIRARLREFSQRPIDLRRDSLLQASLLRVAEDEHVLSLLTHHIVSDGASREILFRDLSVAYSAFLRGEQPTLPDIPVHYSDFASAQRERLSGSALDDAVGYWQRQLADAPALLELPTDRPRSSTIGFAGAELSAQLDPQLVEALTRSARELGVTMHVYMLAAFQALLHRYTAQDDIVVGCAVAMREEEVEDLIGFFANVLPYRVSFAGEPTFAELVKRVSDVALDVYDHADMPLEPLMRALQRGGRPAHARLFEAMMVLEYESDTRLSLGEAAIEVIPHEHEAAATDIALIVRAAPTGVRVALQYRTDLFDAPSIVRMQRAMISLLESAVANASQRVSEMPLMPEAERLRALREWNDTAAPYPTGRATHDFIVETADKVPDAVAVVCGTTRLTYGALQTQSDAVAATLIARGVRIGDLIGVAAERNVQCVINILGILKAGAAYVPLDPTYPAERLAFIAKDAELKLVVSRQGPLDSLCALNALELLSPDDSVTADASKSRREVGGDSPAYVIYTSGSTGNPKGVVVTHENLTASTWARIIRYPELVGRYLMLSSFAFDSSVAGLFWTLVQGGTLVVPEEGAHLDAVSLCALMRAEQVTHLLAIPSFYHALLGEATPEDTKALRVAMVGGDWCVPEMVERHRALAPNAGYYTEYGPTETTVWCSVLGIEPGDPMPPITIGMPMPNGRMYILDPRGEVMPVGVPGEIYVGGAGVTPGYLRRPELTSATFMHDPFTTDPVHNRMYRTGERGRWMPNGEIQFLGRLDHQVKVSGYRVELGEIEAALTRDARVQNAVVLAVGPKTQKRLVGFVEVGELATPDADHRAVNADELRQMLRRVLPEYMVPASITVMARFALNVNGKVDRHALPIPEPGAASGEYVAPADAIEETIATIMADLLGIERMGAKDDFFSMGGSSLVAMRLMARLSRAFDLRLTWAMLFEASTVSALAVRVRQLAAGSSGISARSETIPKFAGDAAPLSFAQELLWLLDRSTPGLNAYNVPMAFRLTQAVDVPALQTALGKLVARHAPLRSTFNAERDGSVSQRASAVPTIPVAQTDLRSVPANIRDAEFTTRLREAIRAPFDITRDVLMRATVFRLDEHSFCLLLVSHHIVFDEFSSHVVVRELGAFYAEAVLGTQANLPALTTTYADYAAWQRDSAERGALVQQLAYWRERLRDLPMLDLPTIGSRPAVPRFEGARRRFTLSSELLERFQALSVTHDVTLYMALLATLKTLLHRYSGQDDIVVGAPITTRSREEFEGLVGFFPNVLVLRTALDGDPTFAELLTRVRATCVGGFAHQDVPLEKLALELRDAGRSTTDPLVQVLFLVESRIQDSFPLGDIEMRPVPVDFGTAKFDITVAMRESDEGLGVSFEYRTDLFDDATIDRMFGHLELLLDAAATNPNEHISRLPLLTAPERRQVVREWNDTARDYPADVTLHELIEAQVRRTPEGVAVSDARETLTYSELNNRANALAAYLRALGTRPGALVGIAAERSVEMVVGLLAVIKAGGAYVPIDPEYPADRVAYMLADSAVKVLLTQSRLVEKLPSADATVVLLDAALPENTIDADSQVVAARASDPAYMIYTSGSTGRPKGAINAHSGIVNRLLWMRDEYRVGPSDVVLQKTPFSFDVSVWEFFLPLISGARLYMATPGGHRDTGYLADIIVERGITVCHFVPSMLRAFLANPAVANCMSLRDVMASGEALAPDLVSGFHTLLPSARLHNLYGPTECAVDVTYWPCPPVSTPPAVVPIGRPVANTQVYVLDQHNQPVPIGIPGELYLAGIQVGLGYHGRPELTAERFVPDPYAGTVGARMYRTGDRARWRADGTVEYLGRLDFQVKVRGFRIELGEIETTLAQHPEVQDVAVMAHDDGGDSRLVAYVVPSAEPVASATDESVERWREVFDRTYSHAEETGDAVESGFNIAGWISSYDKRPIAASEMREWVDRTCDRILDLKPKRVLEIGCGTGLLLFRIAPHVDYYHGLDIAESAILGIQADPAFQPLRDHVVVEQARADETTELAEGSFDTIVINSVIQYFPSVEYLLTVLRRAVRLVAPGGAIFVGDVRLLPLLETLHTSVALYDAGEGDSITDLRAIAQQRLWHESELVVDPAFFDALRLEQPRIVEADVMIKRARASNELSKFRGDVVLRFDRAPAAIPPHATPAVRTDSLDDVRALLKARPPVLRLPDLVDARVARDIKARELIASAPAQGTVRELSLDSSVPLGVDPEALATISPDYDVLLFWPETGTVGRFDAVLRLKGAAVETTDQPAPNTGIARPWNDFVHHPATESFPPEQVARWRTHLGASLPDYMVPSAFVRLSEMPLSPSGKVDRKALRPPVLRRPTKAHVAPRTATETAIAALWSEILHIDEVSVEDGFLELGGHSLLAMRVVGRVRREMGVSVGLDALVRGETIAVFAALVDAARGAPAEIEEDDDFALVPVSRDAFRRTNAPSGSGQ